jgi:hypothetical protein
MCLNYLDTVKPALSRAFSFTDPTTVACANPCRSNTAITAASASGAQLTSKPPLV